MIQSSHLQKSLYIIFCTMARRDADTPQRSTATLIKTALRVVRDVFKVTPGITLYLMFGVIVFGLTPFAYSYIQSEVIDELTKFVGTEVAVYAGGLGLLIVLYILLSLGSKLNDAIFNYFDRIQYQRLTQHFTIEFIKKASELDLYHYEDSKKNDLIQRAKQSYGFRPQNMFIDTLWTVSAAVTVVTSVGIVASFSIPIFIVLLLTTIPTLIVNIKKADLSYGIWDATTETRRRFYDSSGHLQDENSLMELRIFGTKSYLFDIVKNTFIDFFSKEQKASQQHTLWDSLTGLLSEIGLVIVMIAAIAAVINGDITIGLFTFYSSSASRFSGNLGSLFRKLTRVREGANYMYDYYDFLNLENTIVPGDKKIIRTDDKTPPRIEFKHVDFSYPGTEKPILNNFELTIEPGERITIKIDKDRRILNSKYHTAGHFIAAVVEKAYPDLKADKNFLELQRELSDTENKIQSARRFYNTMVRDYETAIRTFPSNIFAGIFKFTEREYFELPIDSEERDNVKVDF